MKEFTSIVYARPDYIETLKRSTPIADHVFVDFELRGCPINQRQLVEVIGAVPNGRKPNIPPHSVCVQCKRHGIVCVMVARGIPCLGPVTQDGCGAICPAYGRGCYGCFGPKETPNTASLSRSWSQLGVSEQVWCALFAGSTRVPNRFAGRVRPMKSETFKVDYLARVEGEGAMSVKSATVR